MDREAPPRELPPATAPATNAAMVADYAQTLAESSDPSSIESVAVALASSDLAQAHRTLGEFLQAAAFLQRLDTEEAYAATYAGLRLNNVIANLARNPAASAAQELLALTNLQLYNDQVLRIQILIRALAFLPGPPESAIDYWREKGGPESPLSMDVVEAAAANRSDAALQFFTGMLLDSGFDRYEKQDWLRQMVAPLRYDVDVLAALQALLRNQASQDLKVDIVEALFDYQPEDWYIDDPVVVPARESAGQNAVSLLNDIAEHALAELSLPDELRSTVEEFDR